MLLGHQSSCARFVPKKDEKIKVYVVSSDNGYSAGKTVPGYPHDIHAAQYIAFPVHSLPSKQLIGRHARTAFPRLNPPGVLPADSHRTSWYGKDISLSARFPKKSPNLTSSDCTKQTLHSFQDLQHRVRQTEPQAASLKGRFNHFFYGRFFQIDHNSLPQEGLKIGCIV